MKTNALALLRTAPGVTSSTGVESTLSVLFLLFATLAISEVAPHAGTVLMKFEFPLVAVWLLARPVKDKFDPSTIFPATYLLWCWLASITIIPGFFSQFDDAQWQLYLLGFIAYWGGSLLINDQSADPRTLRGLRVIWREDLFFFFMLAMGVAAFLAWMSITISEGIPIFRNDVETLRVELVTRHHLALPVMVFSSAVTLPLSFFYLWTASKPRFKKTLYLFCIFSSFLFISTGDRGMILPSLLSIFAMRQYLKKSFKFAHLAIVAIILGLLLSFSGYYRSLQHWGPGYAIDLAHKGISLTLQPFIPIYFSVRSPMETLRRVLELIPLTTPYQLGQLSFGFFNQLLPGRHPSSDFFFKNLLGLQFVGFGDPASILGTFYADFGVAGVVVGMFLTGLVSKMLYLRMFRHSLGWIMVYCFIWQKLIGSMYGSLFTYVTDVLVPLTWLILVSALTGPVAYKDRV